MEVLTEQKNEIAAPAIQIAKFVNFSDEDFTWSWNSVPYSFKAGETKYMSRPLAEHFAKHLVNRELIKDGKDNDTSPKKKEDNAIFMAMFNKAVFVVDAGVMDETKAEQEAIDMQMKQQLGETPAAPAKSKSQAKREAILKTPKKEESFEEVEVPADDDSDE